MAESFLPFSIDFSIDPLSFEPKDEVIRRTMSSMKEAFLDQKEVENQLAKGDPLIVEVLMAPMPKEKGFMTVNINAVYPGMVGNEYFMTMGHIHSDPVNDPEVYITMKGEGMLVLQNREGHVHVEEMRPGKINYIPSTYAHRCVNIGQNDPLIYIGVFPSTTERDYTFSAKSFKEIVVAENGKPVLVPNPRYDDGK